MRNFIKKYLYGTKIYTILKCIKNINNDEFIRNINDINNKNKIVCFRNGIKNIDKNIFVININVKYMGLGAYLRYSLLGFYEARMMNFYPVINYGKNCMYKEKNIFLGTNNVFEYYFNQPSKITLEEINVSNRIYSVNFDFIKECEVNFDVEKKTSYGYKIEESYIKTLGTIAKDYLILNKRTQDFIEKSFNIYLKNFSRDKILGVHVRGTDYALNWKNHPNMVTVEDFFVEVDKALKMYDFKYIFLATDDSNRLEAFKNKYKEKLIYFSDVHRSSGKVNVALEKNNRENNAYLNGLEVIRDIYTLAQCQGLIAGLSQVSIMARIINYSLDKNYSYKKIIDKGIYKG